MVRLTLKIFVITLVALALSGCGIHVLSPEECEMEAPQLLTKAEYLKEWGAPDSIKFISDNEEIWTYEKYLWCGGGPVLVIPVPLFLPVCNGFDQVYFDGETALRVHTRHGVWKGGVIVIWPAAGEWKGKACVKPIPQLSQEIKSDKSVSLIVMLDTPEHQQTEEIQEVMNRFRKLLAERLLSENGGIFRLVTAPTESADYEMQVTITSVRIPGKLAMATHIWSFEIHTIVKIKDLNANHIIGNFKVDAVTDAGMLSTIPTLDRGINLTIEEAVSKIVINNLSKF